MIYLPDEVTSNMCAYVYDKDIIRVYDTRPTYNTIINYTDYFINSNYLTRTGSTSFGSYTTLNYNCIDYNNFTTSYLYRNDLDKILIIALIFIGVCWFLISKIWKRLFYGRKVF